MWLFNVEYKKNDIGKLLVLHSDNSWMKIQKYKSIILFCQNKLVEYNWDSLLSNVDNLDFDTKVDQFLYPKLIQIEAVSKFGRLTSKYLKIKSREGILNPDWDGDVFLKLFSLFAEGVGWTPPTLPKISTRIEGQQFKLPLNHVKAIGLKKFLKNKKVFSYAITNPNDFSYTLFQSYHSNA